MYNSIIMKKIFRIVLILITWFLSAYMLNTFATVDIPGADKITPVVMWTTVGDGTLEGTKDFWFRILWVARIAISGLALIYLVMIGVYMILASDNEENIKKQRKQIMYIIIGFLFLNVPSMVYNIFLPDSWGNLAWNPDWNNTNGGSIFWNTAGFTDNFGNIIAFLRVFAFGAAVTMFTWGLFNLLVSGGDDEKRKMAKNRIIYGLLGLIFMGFVGLWWELVAGGDFNRVIPSVSGNIFSLVMYFVAPISIFMLIYWAYYFITSWGDEERMKKWKSILINTGIAIIILLSALSFMTDLTKFQL